MEKEFKTRCIPIKTDWFQWVLLCAFIVPFTPVAFNKAFASIVISLIYFKILCNINISRINITNIFFILLLTPGSLILIFNEDLNIIRLFPLLLLFLVEFVRDIYIKRRFSIAAILFALIYMISLQLFIAFGWTPAIEFRDMIYPIDYNYWDYGIFEYDDLLKIILDFRGDSLRAGGIFYNPNVIGSLYVLYLLLLYIVTDVKQCIRGNSYSYIRIFATIVAFVGSVLSGSRTALGGLIIFLIAYYSINGYKRFSKIGIFKILLFGAAAIIALIICLKYAINTFLIDDESGASKLLILISYIESAGLDDILFGGNTNIQFDEEYGYWFGAVGLCGVASIIWYYIRMVKSFRGITPFILAISVLGVGGTTVYGLLTSILIVLLMICASSFYRQQNMVE